MALLLVSLVSWAVAVVSYVVIIYVTHGRVSVRDTQSLAFWGGVMVTIAVPLVYLPALTALRTRLRSWWPFPIVGALLGIAPLVLLLMLWDGGNPVAGLFSQAGAILTVVFGAFGTTFGAGFHFSHRHKA